MAMSAPNQYDFISWHQDSGQKVLFQNEYFYAHKMNDHNQLIFVKGKELLFLGKFPYPKFINYMLDPEIGLISLDGYVPLRGSFDYLVLKDINNKGWIIGAIQSTKGVKGKGILFEPIPEKMEQMPKKEIKQENIVLE